MQAGCASATVSAVARTTWCNLHHAREPCQFGLRAISGHCNDVSPFSNVVRLKPAPRLPERPVCTRFGACVMSVLFQGGGALWTNTSFQQQTGPTTSPLPAPEFGNGRRRRRQPRTTNIASLPTTGCVTRSTEFAQCTSTTTIADASPNRSSKIRAQIQQRPQKRALFQAAPSEVGWQSVATAHFTDFPAIQIFEVKLNVVLELRVHFKKEYPLIFLQDLEQLNALRIH